MNRGIELLLKRMDSHPEEFADDHNPYRDEYSRWGRLLSELAHRMEIIDRDNGKKGHDNSIRAVRYTKPLGYLSDEEVVLIHTKLMEVQREQFEQRVMAALLEQKPQPEPADASYPVLAQAMTAPYGKSY